MIGNNQMGILFFKNFGVNKMQILFAFYALKKLQKYAKLSNFCNFLRVKNALFLDDF